MNDRPLLFLAWAAAACQPEFSDEQWRIRAPRVLAVKSEPAEAKPGTPLVYTALVATVEPGANPVPSWGYCTAPKPPIENNVVSTACLSAASLLPIGQGVSIASAVPNDACQRFGPDVLSGSFRPRDPDATGGYYQPLRLELPGAPPVFHLERIKCPLRGAAAETARDFGERYVENQNPALVSVVATSAGQAVDFSRVPAGARLRLTASFAPGGAEEYSYFDPSTQALTTRREAMQVAWYVSDGTLDSETTGRGETDLDESSSNGWLAPSAPGRARLWVVLRDSRGGVDFSDYELTVLP